MQVTFQGRPLYFFANDMAAGERNGERLGDAWFGEDQAPVALQINGSSVTTAYIYTTNGVIHVIETDITETLNTDPM